ncbi:hypothetical protein GCM10022408_20630 [Hymenobacter fastidiosus]|uniref:Outer membrane protein beta-barrel domain-containing protein n=2 Tax=Hymenobacter fastidiosus TaxID=486264 RepID=A0ABP7S8V3_9BACT
MSGYYIRANTSVDGISFAPTLHATYAFSPRLAFRSSVAYERLRLDRDESWSTGRYVQHKVVYSTVVPVQLQFVLNPAAQKLRVALLGGLTFRYTDINDRRTYHSSGTTATTSDDQVEQRTDAFLSGGLALRYQATPRWSALADGTLGGRLGGEKTQYYELLPSAMLMVGVGYSLGSRP